MTRAVRILLTCALLAAFMTAGGAKCSLAKKKKGNALSGGNTMFVVTTDFATGTYSTINPTTRTSTTNIQTIHSDAVARVFGGYVYVINRAGQSNLTVVAPHAGYQVVAQYTTNDPAGIDSNPQDIEFLNASKAYVLRYELNTILIMNPISGVQMGTISLASMIDPDGAGAEPTDPDGLVEMSGGCIHNGTLYVTVQRLDRTNFYSPVGTSYVVMINTATDTITGSIPLGFANPSGDLRYIPSLDRLALVCSGSFGVADGAIQLIDPNSNVLDGTAAVETSFTGDFNDFVFLSATKAYVLYNDFSFNLKVRAFNPTTSTPAASDLLSVSGFNISGLERTPDGSQIFVGDRTSANPGVRVYDTATDTQVTTVPIDTGLPPFEIRYVP